MIGVLKSRLVSQSRNLGRERMAEVRALEVKHYKVAQNKTVWCTALTREEETACLSPVVMHGGGGVFTM